MKTLVSLLFIILISACNSKEQAAEEKSVQDARHLANQSKTINALTIELSNCRKENRAIKMQMDSVSEASKK